jgi:hypothetical protein
MNALRLCPLLSIAFLIADYSIVLYTRIGQKSMRLFLNENLSYDNLFSQSSRLTIVRISTENGLYEHCAKCQPQIFINNKDFLCFQIIKIR